MFFRLENILLKVPLLSVNNKKEHNEAFELIKICREYILGLKMETERRILAKNQPTEVKRQCEMAAYFTHCKLQTIHR